MIAIIPARGGSKGVPKKNVKELNGKPLIAYTIQAAKESGIFEKIIISTDDQEIADVAIRYGAGVPFLRPDILSGDAVASDDVIRHALAFFKDRGNDYSEVCKLQPTSPLRTWRHIQEAYDLFKSRDADFVVSVCECEHSPLWTDTITEDLSMDNFMKGIDKAACRQDLPTYYRLNGAIYMAKTQSFLTNKSFIGKGCLAYIMNQDDSVDIDNPIDFKLAELLIKGKRRENKI